jgi:tRNA G46 methylase TrmB
MPRFPHIFRRRTSATAPITDWKPQHPVVQVVNEQRTYLADAPYLLPKDAQEDQRLNFQHHVLYRTISNHYLAPISPTTTTILDVGTGTGIWPLDMAALFPQAHILGVDVVLRSLPYPC